VRDSGIGIAAQDLDHIFEGFTAPTKRINATPEVQGWGSLSPDGSPMFTQPTFKLRANCIRARHSTSVSRDRDTYRQRSRPPFRKRLPNQNLYLDETETVVGAPRSILSMTRPSIAIASMLKPRENRFPPHGDPSHLRSR
jgi:hypothetical protein